MNLTRHKLNSAVSHTTIANVSSHLNYGTWMYRIGDTGTVCTWYGLNTKFCCMADLNLAMMMHRLQHRAYELLCTCIGWIPFFFSIAQHCNSSNANSDDVSALALVSSIPALYIFGIRSLPTFAIQYRTAQFNRKSGTELDGWMLWYQKDHAGHNSSNEWQNGIRTSL